MWQSLIWTAYSNKYKEREVNLMGLRTFRGGVHPFEGKDLSKDKPVEDYLPKGDLVLPVSQHIGAPAQPVVAVGDTVKKGQLIAEAGGFISFWNCQVDCTAPCRYRRYGKFDRHRK